MKRPATRFAYRPSQCDDVVGGVSWSVVIASVVLITPIAQGVHAYMLESLGIAFPHDEHVARWASYLNVALSTGALLVFCSLARPALERLRFVTRCLAVTAIDLTLRETFRLVVIDGYLTTAWEFHVVKTMPRLLFFFSLCGVVVAAAPRLRNLPAKAAGAAIIAGLALFGIRPLIDVAFAPLLQSMASLDLPERYAPPYDLAANLVIYATFIEPVVATFVIAALVWPRLSQWPVLRLFQFVLLVLLMKQSLVPTLLFSFWIDAPLGYAVLSESQFLLEALTLALATGLAWGWATRPDRDKSRSRDEELVRRGAVDVDSDWRRS